MQVFKKVRSIAQGSSQSINPEEIILISFPYPSKFLTLTLGYVIIILILLSS